jgi:hypothetical protein
MLDEGMLWDERSDFGFSFLSLSYRNGVKQEKGEIYTVILNTLPKTPKYLLQFYAT